MKRIIIVSLLVLLFIPVIVNAAECDTSKVYIDSISIDKNSNVEELDDATVEDKNINLNLGMSDVGDNIKYKLIIKNTSNEDYLLDKNSIKLSSDYIDYSIESEDNSNIVKANSTKSVYLSVQYKNAVPESAYTNGTFTDNISMKVNLSTNENIPNPNTGIPIFIFIINILLFLIMLSYIQIKSNKYSKKILLIICLLMLIPIGVNALCKCELKINSSITIVKKSYFYSHNNQNLEQTLNNDYTYDNIDDALNAFGHDYIVRLAVNYENKVIEEDLVFKIDNNTYYLSGGVDRVSYESKKEQIENIFGIDNCDTDQYSYYCSNGHLIVRIYESGFTSISDENYYCTISESGYSFCSDD